VVDASYEIFGSNLYVEHVSSKYLLVAQFRCVGEYKLDDHKSLMTKRKNFSATKRLLQPN
jgi:hypothetical protein